MLVYLVHPDHGTHIAYDQDDVDRCLKTGWTIRPENWKELKGGVAPSANPMALPTKRRKGS